MPVEAAQKESATAVPGSAGLAAAISIRRWSAVQLDAEVGRTGAHAAGQVSRLLLRRLEPDR